MMFEIDTFVGGCPYAERDYWGDFTCGADSILSCDDCKYGAGDLDPFDIENQDMEETVE